MIFTFSYYTIFKILVNSDHENRVRTRMIVKTKRIKVNWILSYPRALLPNFVNQTWRYGFQQMNVQAHAHTPYVYVCWQISNLVGSRRIIFQYEWYEWYDVRFGTCVEFWSQKRNKSNTSTEPYRNKYGLLKNNACFYQTLQHEMIQQQSQTAICTPLVLFELPKTKTS